MLAWFLLLSLVPLLGSNTIGYLQSRRITEQLLERSLRAVSLAQAFHVQDRVERHVVFLEAVAAGNEFLNAAIRRAGGTRGPVEEIAGPEAVGSYLARQKAEAGDFSDLLLLSATGGLISASGGSDPGGEETPCAARVSALSVARSADAAGPPHICLTVPVTDIGGREVGFLSGVVGPAQLGSFFQLLDDPGNGIHTTILDETGRPLISSLRMEDLDFSRPLDLAVAEAGSTSRARYANATGVEVAARRTTIPGLPWTQVTEVPVEDALGPLDTLRWLAIYLAAAFAVLVIAAAWFVSGGIVAPIHRLVEATRKLGAGDLHARIEAPPLDEIGELGRAFNDMASELASASEREKELHRREIERAQQLASVGELASGLAHEIRNPVIGISNGLDLVRSRVGPDPKLDPILDEADREVERIHAAIRDLLAFARPATPTLAASDGNDIVARAFRLVQPSADRKGVHMEMQSDPELPSLNVDGEMLRQAFVNVLLNAVQATPAGGHVHVLTGVCDGQLVVQVSDTGSGIPEAQREEIFKPFFTTRHTGTGLGLSITREIVQRHGGRIRVRKGPAGGSVFEILLPLERAPHDRIETGEGG